MKNILIKSFLPVFFLLLINCSEKKEKHSFDESVIVSSDVLGYQHNDMLIDSVNDEKLMTMDTILYFSDMEHLYCIEVEYENIKITIYKWKNIFKDKYKDYVAKALENKTNPQKDFVVMDFDDYLPDKNFKISIIGFQKDGFIYTKDLFQPDRYSISYKILLNKGLFVWDDMHWFLVNAGGS
ncbi:hypothetical protein FACS1894180_4580 [Bacteroidia bacterium]|nr:hypothetical protein FACS1894180_4580 [Bacteroidia bacterium]